MPTTAERLDALERENAELRARLAAVEAPKIAPAIAPPPSGGRGPIDPRYLHGTDVVRSEPKVEILADPLPPDMTPADLLALRRLITATRPTIAPPLSGEDERRALRRFANALRAVGKLWGADVLDRDHDVEWWVGHARALVDHATGEADFNGNDFTAAALASGVLYRWSPGKSVEFGLQRWQIYGSFVGTWPLRDTWRDTLKRGAIMPPQRPGL